MALTVNSSGTRSAVVNTEHTEATVTSSGTYIFVVDATNMVTGDTLELRMYLKTLSGSTSHLAYIATYSGAQTDPVKVSVPVPATHEVKVSIKQTAGTSRNFDWELMAL